MKVALATHDMTRVDAHFNGARTLVLYDVDPEGYRFVEAIQFAETSAEDGRHSPDGEDRIKAKVEALEGVALLFVKAIGGPAAARVVQARIHPIKVADDEPIVDVLERVRRMLGGNPPPWLRKIMMAQTGDKPARPSFLDDEDDDLAPVPEETKA
ncbi:nitrogen fixation protein NifX [Pararhodospirillum oryzae]|uniref:Nitrogen fixation protein NifX n=1 Tax=Pararhodospirillum oryzae TaxID=478448 RepID=A0A512H6K0_9PROT|nr:nitrogen fixation protein NifX [Pararhodospirillum oryzae]GEO81089.1 nitrogen fixation protein NifX [Pararhodospirillum oryzae]